MSLPPESIEAGKHYLMETGEVWQVIAVLPYGQVLFERQPGRRLDPGPRLLGSRELHAFAAQAVRKGPL